jgi:hypothetical protein
MVPTANVENALTSFYLHRDDWPRGDSLHERNRFNTEKCRAE